MQDVNRVKDFAQRLSYIALNLANHIRLNTNGFGLRITAYMAAYEQ